MSERQRRRTSARDHIVTPTRATPGAYEGGLRRDQVTGLPPTGVLAPYSHSIVPGGFDVMSYATRFTPGTSLMMRLEMRSSTS